MHTPLDAPCCCKPAQPTDRLEQVCCRGLQRVPGETSQDPLSIGLDPNSVEREPRNGLVVWQAEGEELEPRASAPLSLVPEVRLRSPERQTCGCGGS